MEFLVNHNESFDKRINFNFEYLDSLDFEEQKIYLSKVLVRLDDGNHCIIIRNQPHFYYGDCKIKQVIINRFDDKLAEWYLNETKILKNDVDVNYFIDAKHIYKTKDGYKVMPYNREDLFPEKSVAKKSVAKKTIWQYIFG